MRLRALLTALTWLSLVGCIRSQISIPRDSLQHWVAVKKTTEDGLVNWSVLYWAKKGEAETLRKELSKADQQLLKMQEVDRNNISIIAQKDRQYSDLDRKRRKGNLLRVLEGVGVGIVTGIIINEIRK